MRVFGSKEKFPLVNDYPRKACDIFILLMNFIIFEQLLLLADDEWMVGIRKDSGIQKKSLV